MAQTTDNRQLTTARRAKYDVIVIGAGAAGLATARALSGAGRKICIVEARDRIGGRVSTLHLPDLPLPIELGAEFIHGEGASTFDIVDAAALTAIELPDDHWWSHDGVRERINDYWGQIAKIRAKIGARRNDLSFDAFLRSQKNLTQRLRDMACGFVEGYHAAHADRMSTLALRLADGEQEAEGRQFRLAGGQDAIIEWLRSGLEPTRTDLRLNTVVTRVQWSKRAVTVETRTREGHATDRIHAKSLVVTIPIGVWKAPRDQEGAIEFDPPLREKERALETLEAGHVVKIAFRFRERFWDHDVNFIHTNDRFMPTWWTASPVRSPILTGWAGGRAAEAMLADGEDAMTDRGLDSLSRAWPIPRRRLDALLAGTYHHDWQRDPYTRGAYSYAGVGGSNSHALLGKPMQGTLFFAGEATSGDETGTVAGAIESGKRAARELIRTFKQ